MDVSVSFPLFVFEKDDCSMRLVESPDKVLYHMEPIDIENEEYLYWDPNGRAVRISITAQRVIGIAYGEAEMPLAEAFVRHSEAFGLDVNTTGHYDQVWCRLKEAESRLPGRKGFLSRLFVVAPAPVVVENRPPDFWSSSVGKFLGSAGDYLLCFAISSLGSNAILGEINPIVHTHSFSGLAAKMWISGVTVAALLGFFVTRYRPTRMALWIWMLPVALLIYRIVLYSTTRTHSIFEDSVLQHFVAPNCPESVWDCRDFSSFTLLAARTLAYSLAAWVSLHFQRPLNRAKILK